MLESKGGKRFFSRGIDDLVITPNPRCDVHQGSSHQEWMHKATPPQSLGLCLILDALA
jgi:hypothetical protein